MTPGVFGLRLLRSRNLQDAALSMVLLIVGAFRLIQLLVLSAEPKWALDLSYYWTAGRRLLAGLAIYSAQQLSGPYVPEAQEGFLYPPPFAAAFAPLSALFPAGYGELSWLWLVTGIGILVATVAAIVRAEGLDRSRFAGRSFSPRWFIAAALMFPPVLGELDIGNVHLELLGLLGVAWLGLRRQDPTGDRVAGVAIAAATIVKIFPGLLIVWLLASRRWLAAIWAIGGLFVLALLFLPFTGTQPWLDYVSVLANMGAVHTTYDSVAPTVWIAPLFGFGPARLIVLLAGGALVFYVARSRPARVGYAMSVTASVLIAPAVFHHYLSVLVLPLLLALAAGVPSATVMAAYFLMWGGQQPALGEWAWVLSRVPQTLGWALLLFGLATVKPRLPSARRFGPDPRPSSELEPTA